MDVLLVPQRAGELDLDRLLKELSNMEISQLLVEGGSGLAGSLVKGSMVQEVAAFIAASILGGDGALSPVGGDGIKRLADALQLSELQQEVLGRDILLSARVSSQ